MGFDDDLPSGKRWHDYETSPSFNGKENEISVVIFNSKLWNYRMVKVSDRGFEPAETGILQWNMGIVGVDMGLYHLLYTIRNSKGYPVIMRER